MSWYAEYQKGRTQRTAARQKGRSKRSESRGKTRRNRQEKRVEKQAQRQAGRTERTLSRHDLKETRAEQGVGAFGFGSIEGYEGSGPGGEGGGYMPAPKAGIDPLILLGGAGLALVLLTQKK